ncbi:hypothetical protein [Myxococcus landrumensis]|uniref:Lysozyme inhibitor LprI N-terminal domain-containing protein n=1 Tax=Myxococcus landrumensis TaxID=2813577 RepID=A0ABX7NDZ0_9BACT|nr:hypothetical protein [Myxococcus landrumus]QSQ15820.1 hypothetical protein JY572_07120 [Myxococcus landrumus]
MSAPDPRKDPRFRRYRGAAYGIYITLTALFSIWILWNVSRSVAAMTPEKLPPAAQALSYRDCLAGARALWDELEAGREKLVRVSPARDTDQEWMRFRTEWMQRLRVRESECDLQARERAPLRTVYGRLEVVLDLYTTHAVQYADEVGGTVDAFHAAFKAAANNPAAQAP